jgi:hypothetical protein
MNAGLSRGYAGSRSAVVSPERRHPVRMRTQMKLSLLRRLNRMGGVGDVDLSRSRFVDSSSGGYPYLAVGGSLT